MDKISTASNETSGEAKTSHANLEMRTLSHAHDKAGNYLFSILVSANCAYPLGFRPEKEFDHFAKDVHLNEEIQVGDSEFDRAVYITSDEPETKELLKDQTLRSVIFKLVSNRFSIEVKTNEIEFTILRKYKTDETANQALVAQYYEDFARLKSILENRMVTPKLDLDGKYNLRQVVLFLVWFAILIFGAVQADHYSYYSHQLLRSESSVYMGMLATALSVIGFFLNFKILGKHSRTFRSLGVLLIAMVPAIFMLVFAYLPSQDVALDFSPGRPVEAVLVKKTHGTVKAHDYYDLYYQYVDGGYFSTLVRKSDMTDFGRHSEGEKIVLKIHPGYFHMPWYEIQ